MSDLKILKVKLVKGGEKLVLSLHEEDNITAENAKVCSNPPHQDLIDAINALASHYALLLDYATEKNYKETKELENITVTGYSIGGKEDDQGIMIFGHRLTKRGKAASCNTPFERFDEDEAS